MVQSILGEEVDEQEGDSDQRRRDDAEDQEAQKGLGRCWGCFVVHRSVRVELWALARFAQAKFTNFR